MFKSVIVFAVLVLVKVLATPLSRPNFIEDESRSIIALEEPCVRQGGMCVPTHGCLRDNVVKLADLCPLQSHAGVVCCYL